MPWSIYRMCDCDVVVRPIIYNTDRPSESAGLLLTCRGRVILRTLQQPCVDGHGVARVASDQDDVGGLDLLVFKETCTQLCHEDCLESTDAVLEDTSAMIAAQLLPSSAPVLRDASQNLIARMFQPLCVAMLLGASTSSCRDGSLRRALGDCLMRIEGIAGPICGDLRDRSLMPVASNAMCA